MTSSLPAFPLAATPASTNPADAATLTLLGSPADGPTPDFATLMVGGTPAASPASAAAANPAAPTATSPAAVACTATTLAFVLQSAPAAKTQTTAAVAPADATDAADTPADATTPAAVRAEVLEQAVAWLASVLAPLLPAPVTPPDATAGTASPSDAAPATGETAPRPECASSAALLSTLRAAVSHFLRHEPATPLAHPDESPAAAANASLPAEAEVTAPSAATNAFPSSESASVAPSLAPAALPTALEAVAPAPATPQVSVTRTEDDAIAVDLDLIPPTPETESHLTASAEATAEVTAEIALPGQAVVRLCARGFVALDAGTTGEFVREAIFAGQNPGARNAQPAAGNRAERNFEFTAGESLKASPKKAGIAVAQTGPNMPSAPTEEVAVVRPAVQPAVTGVSGDVQVAPSATERITASPAAPAGQTFAERAVAAVTGLVEAQFSASMQKSGTVALRLKLGGADLSVRVELRGHEVLTDFRTDSAELRAAITREWQAVAAASPEQMRRYADPVFSPATPSSASTGGDSGSSARQQSAQQEQSSRPRFFPEEAAPFARRSLLGESFFPEAVAPRQPAFHPASSRLSVLA